MPASLTIENPMAHIDTMSNLQPIPDQTPRRAFGLRLLGTVLLIGSVGLVSCQALFTL